MPQQSDQRDRMHKVKIAAAVVLFIIAGGFVAKNLLQGSPADYANDRGFKCSECGYDYAYVVKSGDIEPLECPKCNKRSAYQAEMCYWTKGPDGQYVAKTAPTLVLLKGRIDPTSTEPTYCPDCGHEVVGHNPKPAEALMLEASGREGRD